MPSPLCCTFPPGRTAAPERNTAPPIGGTCTSLTGSTGTRTPTTTPSSPKTSAWAWTGGNTSGTSCRSWWAAPARARPGMWSSPISTRLTPPISPLIRRESWPAPPFRCFCGRATPSASSTLWTRNTPTATIPSTTSETTPTFWSWSPISSATPRRRTPIPMTRFGRKARSPWIPPSCCTCSMRLRRRNRPWKWCWPCWSTARRRRGTGTINPRWTYSLRLWRKKTRTISPSASTRCSSRPPAKRPWASSLPPPSVWPPLPCRRYSGSPAGTPWSWRSWGSGNRRYSASSRTATTPHWISWWVCCIRKPSRSCTIRRTRCMAAACPFRSVSCLTSSPMSPCRTAMPDSRLPCGPGTSWPPSSCKIFRS